MVTKKSRPDRQLTKLKLGLVAGGLVATIVGADLLGDEAVALTGIGLTGTETAITTSVGSAWALDSAIPAALDLELEAIPTVTAPTVRSARVAMGRASG